MPKTALITEKPWLKGLAVASVAALTLSACGGNGDDDGGGEAEAADADTEVDTEVSTDAEVETITEGTLQVCSDVPYPPFEYYDTDGNVVGYDVDVASAIASAMGLELQIIESAWEGLQSGVALNAGDCDLTLSGMTITEERAGNMQFSDPYLDDNLGLLATADSGIESTDDLDGVTVGVQTATTGDTYASEELGLDVVQYEDSGLMLQGLQSGQVEALIGNISIIGYQTGEDDQYVFAEEIDTGEQLGVAAQLDNDQLIEAVNEILAELESSGELEEMQQTWFESDTPEEGEGAEGGAAEEDTAEETSGDEDDA